MSSFKASTSTRSKRSATRRGALCALAIGFAAAGLGGCAGGFQPMYGSLGGHSVEAKLAQVEFTPIPGRNGQRIRNELIFKSYGGDNPQPAKYRLDVAIKESTTTTLVLRDGTSGGMIYQIDARFQLIDLTTKKVMLEGLSQGRAASERFANVFSNVRAAEDAQDRASKVISTDLKARLAGFLSSVEG